MDEGLRMLDSADGELTYVQALTELRDLVEQLSNEQDIDLLAKKVSRAKILIDFCRSRISNAELEISQILLEDDAEEPF